MTPEEGDQVRPCRGTRRLGAFGQTGTLVTDTSYTRYGEPQRTYLGDQGKQVWLSTYYETNTRRLNRTITDAGTSAPKQADITYAHDPAGGRRTETQHSANGNAVRTYDNPPTGHKLSSIRTEGPNGAQLDELDYDAAGNTTRRGAQTLDWDSEGRLTTVTEAGKKAEFIYDATGNRLLRKDPTGTTLYLSGQEVRLDKATATVKTTRSYTHGGSAVAMRTPEGLTWLAGGHQGTVQIAIDLLSLTPTRRRSTPFGGSRGQAPRFPGDRGFVGGMLDSSIELITLGARQYDPATGRFLSVDPVINPKDPQQLHGYSYANNSPVTMSDPDGLESCIANCDVRRGLRLLGLVQELTRSASACRWRGGVWCEAAVPRSHQRVRQDEEGGSPHEPASGDGPVQGREPASAPAAGRYWACSRSAGSVRLGRRQGCGSYKPIDEIQVGDDVIATDPETGENGTRKVTAPLTGNGDKTLVRITVDDDEKGLLTVTYNHPLWVVDLGKWVPAGELRVGVLLRTAAGAKVQITAVRTGKLSNACTTSRSKGCLRTVEFRRKTLGPCWGWNPSPTSTRGSGSRATRIPRPRYSLPRPLART